MEQAARAAGSYSYGSKGRDGKQWAAEGLQAARGDRREPSCHSRKLKRKSLEEKFYFAHQTIENRSKEEPKGFVGADSS